MSRATRIRVFIVSGLRPLTSRAHASETLSRAPVEVIAIAAAKPLADRCRNPRLDRPSLASVVSIAVIGVSSCFFSRIVLAEALPEAAGLLQHLDLVAVRVFDEEKARDLLSVVIEFDNLARLEALSLETTMLRVEILDHEGDVAVAVAKIVGLGAILVDRELDFVRRLGIRKIDEREVEEVEAVGDVESERFFVESERPRLLQHADHRVDRFRHSAPGPSRRLMVARRGNASEARGARVLSAYYAAD